MAAQDGQWTYWERSIMANAFLESLSLPQAQAQRIAKGEEDWPKAVHGSPDYKRKRIACDAAWQKVAQHRQANGLPEPHNSTCVTRAAPMYAKRMLQTGSVANVPTLEKGWKVALYQGSMLKRLADAVPKGYTNSKGAPDGFYSIAHACKKSEHISDLVEGMGFKTPEAAERVLRREHPDIYYAVQDDRRTRDLDKAVVRIAQAAITVSKLAASVYARRLLCS